MGSFVYLVGDYVVPEEKRNEFNDAVQKLLTAGGMCHLACKTVSRTGEQGDEETDIYLLEPVVLPKAGDINFNFSYYEDDIWEDAWYDVDEMSFTTGKKGFFQFSDVCCAIALLYEQYCPHCLAMEDGEAVDMYYLGWINHVLGTHYTGEYRLYSYAEKKRYLHDRGQPSETEILHYLPDAGFITSTVDVPTHQIMKTSLSLRVSMPYDETMDRKGSSYPNQEDMVFNMTVEEAAELDDETQATLFSQPAQRIREIMRDGLEGDPDTDKLRQRLDNVLLDIDDYYKKIMMFKKTYDEFQEYPRDPFVRASVIYLEQLSKDLREEGACIQNIRNWYVADSAYKYNLARRKLKQFLGLLYNIELRKKYLGF